MLKNLSSIIGFFIVGGICTLLFNYIMALVKSGVIGKVKSKVAQSTGTVYEERSLTEKLKHDLSPTKFLSSYLRLIPLVLFIMGLVYAYGFFKGQQGKPVQVNLNYEEEMVIPIPGDSNVALHKPKNSNELEWMDMKTGRVVAKVRTRDLPILTEKLKPYGFELKPFATTGLGVGKNVAVEAGVGVHLARVQDWRVGTWVTNKGAYVGVSYNMSKLVKWMNNTFVGVGVGRGYHGDDRVQGNLQIRF